MDEKTFEVEKAREFCQITVKGQYPAEIAHKFEGFFVDVENPDAFIFIFHLFNMMESDEEIIQQVITALVESGYTQIL